MSREGEACALQSTSFNGEAPDSAWASTWTAIWNAACSAEQAPIETRFAELLQRLPDSVLEMGIASAAEVLACADEVEGDEDGDDYGPVATSLIVVARALLYPERGVDLEGLIEDTAGGYAALEVALRLERERRRGAVVQIPADPFQVSEQEAN